MLGIYYLLFLFFGIGSGSKQNFYVLMTSGHIIEHFCLLIAS
jgi:hypothetical protein